MDENIKIALLELISIANFCTYLKIATEAGRLELKELTLRPEDAGEGLVTE